MKSGKITVTTQINIEDLVLDLIQNCHSDQIIKLIKDLDQEMQDWDFTTELADHFKNLMTIKKLEEEQKE